MSQIGVIGHVPSKKRDGYLNIWEEIRRSGRGIEYERQGERLGLRNTSPLVKATAGYVATAELSSLTVCLPGVLADYLSVAWLAGLPLEIRQYSGKKMISEETQEETKLENGRQVSSTKRSGVAVFGPSWIFHDLPARISELGMTTVYDDWEQTTQEAESLEAEDFLAGRGGPDSSLEAGRMVELARSTGASGLLFVVEAFTSNQLLGLILKKISSTLPVLLLDAERFGNLDRGKRVRLESFARLLGDRHESG